MTEGLPLRVGLCGLGSAMRRAHVPALLGTAAPRARVVAVCDPDLDRATAVAASLGGATAHTEVTEVLDAGCDLLVVASPPSAHLGEVAAAVERGVDVLCEKPLGLSAPDVDRLADLVARHPDRLVATVHQYRYAAGWRTVREAAAATLAEGLQLRVAVERPGTDPVSVGGWRARRSEGGILGDHAVHYLALCWHLDPSTEVLSARAWGEPGRETAEISLRLGRGGLAVVRASYAGEVRHNCIEVTTPGNGCSIAWSDGELVVRGARGGQRWAIGALSDRAYVDRLYLALYSDLIAHLDDPLWRRTATEETLAVARLLSRAVALAG